MSEQKKGKRKSAASAVVATVIVAIAAAAAIVVLMMMSKKPTEPEQKLPNGTTVAFKPTQEFADECGENAQKLVAGNYKIVRLFVSEGLAHRDEPYGNRPEDGLYTVESDEYETYEQIETLVKSIFTEEESKRILTQMPSDPAAKDNDTSAAETSDISDTSEEISRPELIAVYAPRDEYVDIENSDNVDSVESVDGEMYTDDTTADGEGEENNAETSKPSESGYVKKSVLGISEYFKPYTDYKKPWGSLSIKIAPASEEECYITVYLGSDKDVDLSSVEDTDILNTKMIKENGEWRLTELVY